MVWTKRRLINEISHHQEKKNLVCLKLRLLANVTKNTSSRKSSIFSFIVVNDVDAKSQYGSFAQFCGIPPPLFNALFSTVYADPHPRASPYFGFVTDTSSCTSCSDFHTCTECTRNPVCAWGGKVGCIGRYRGGGTYPLAVPPPGGC